MTETQELAGGHARLVDGGSLAYQTLGRVGQGIPLLLIRPLGGTMALWGAFRDALAEQLPIIAFDLRGTGDSSDERGWPSTRRIAADAVAVLDHLGVACAHVFGISLGGMAATWIAIDAGHRVARLCIASAPARGLDLTRAGVRRALGLAACFARPSGEVEARLVHRALSHRFRLAHPAQMRRIEAQIREQPTSRVSLLRHAVAAGLHDARDHLHHITSPCLVLAGALDEFVGIAAPRHLAERISDARFDVVADAGHDLTLEQPRASAQRVVRFLQEDIVSPTAREVALAVRRPLSERRRTCV